MLDDAFYMQYLQFAVADLSNSTHTFWESISITIRNNEFSRDELTQTDTFRSGYEGWESLATNVVAPYYDLVKKE